MRKQDSTLRGGRSTTQNKLIKGTDSLFLNSEIGFGYTCEKKDFQHKGDLSCFREKMDLFKSLSASMTMHVSWIFRMSTMLVPLSMLLI